MVLEAREAFHRYANFGRAGYLLGAVDFARNRLREASSQVLMRSGTGDIVTGLDQTVHHAIIDYFQSLGVSALVLGEEGNSVSSNPEFAILLDPIDGSQNSINGLDYGINAAIAEYHSRLRVSDLDVAVVTNFKTGTFFVGERGKGAYKVKDGKREELVHKKSDLYELPSPKAYTVKPDQERRQELLATIFAKVLGNQPRSVDATGARLVEVADSNLRAYGDWRNATKCWDVLPSALILKEAGYVLSDVLGFNLSSAIFYEEARQGGLNRRVGENFITTTSNDYQILLFGESSDNGELDKRNLWDLCVGRSFSIWDKFLHEAIASGKIEPPRYLFGRQKSQSDGSFEFVRFGQMFGEFLVSVVEDKRKTYLELDESQVKDLLLQIRNKYVDCIPSTQFPGGRPLHLVAFDEVVQSR